MIQRQATREDGSMMIGPVARGGAVRRGFTPHVTPVAAIQLAVGLLLVWSASVLVTGCASVGPPTVGRDRFDYVAAISDSWKRQMLQNLLKIRYADAPIFLDVTSVISAYSFEAGLSVSGQVAPVGRGDTFAAGGGNVGYGDKPTITYTPLAGDKFARSLMSPHPVSGILHLLQGGYPADSVLRVCTISINGLDNAQGSRADPRTGDPRFARLLTAIRVAHRAGMLGFRQKSPKDRESAVMYFRAPTEAGADVTREIRDLLGLDTQAREFNVVYDSFPSSKTEIALLTRSTLQVMAEFASYIEVPAADVTEGRVNAPSWGSDQLRLFPPLLRVRSGDEASADAYVAVRYRNSWFWIDDRDARSKVSLSFLMFLFSLTKTGAEVGGRSLVTIPAR